MKEELSQIDLKDISKIQKKISGQSSALSFDRIFNLFKRSNVNFSEITNNTSSLLNIEPAEKYFFNYGFRFRLNRLMTLNLIDVGEMYDMKGIPQKSEVIKESTEVDTVMNRLINATINVAIIKDEIHTRDIISDLNKEKIKEIERQREIVMKGDFTFKKYIGTRIALEKLKEPLPEVNTIDDKPIREWLTQAYSSGTLIATHFHNPKNSPEMLKDELEFNTEKIENKRNLVPNQLMNLINTDNSFI